MTELDKLIKSWQKTYGEGSVMTMKNGKFPKVERIPVESPKIMDVLGGGIPVGRVMELYGPESSGKTSLACYLAGQVQQYDIPNRNRKGVVGFIDAEHAIDPEYAKSFNFKVEDAIFSQPDSGEQALDIALSMAQSGEIDFIVVDSVAALTPKAEIEGEMGDMQIGAQARLMGKGIRKIISALSDSNCTILFINQIRMTMAGFGNPECVTPDTIIDIL